MMDQKVQLNKNNWRFKKMEMAKLQLEKEKLELEKAIKQQELDTRLQM